MGCYGGDWMQSMHLTILCHALKLYIPEWLKGSQASGLNRLRRRGIRELLRLRLRKPGLLRSVAWLHRNNGYLGHLLRRSSDRLARQELLCSMSQQRRGPASACQRGGAYVSTILWMPYAEFGDLVQSLRG